MQKLECNITVEDEWERRYREKPIQEFDLISEIYSSLINTMNIVHDIFQVINANGN